MQGFLNINKPSGVTSAYVVNQVKKKFHISKIGHMGTLDPMASGVLLLATGKATRLFDYVLEKTKQYVAVFSFGYETDTLDADGAIVNTTKVIPTKQQVQYAIKLLTGKQQQMPPKYSAKKINGKKAYELARANQEFTLKIKEVEISEFTLLKQISKTDYEFSITCSSGTYIRSLARDLGVLVNSLCTMTKLERVTTGKFELKNSVSLADILLKDSLEYDIIKVEDVLPFTKLYLNNNQFNKLKNGQTVSYNKEDGFYFVFCEKMLLGIAECNNNLLKLKTFLLEDEKEEV